MNLSQRQKQFLNAVKNHFGTPESVRPRELFGVSNSAKIIEGGIQLGVVNLDNVKEDTEALIFGCVLKFPPEDEVYFAVLVKKNISNFMARLAEMKRLGGASGDGEEESSDSGLSTDLDDDSQTPPTIKYRSRNNLVSVYLANDGHLWLRNAQFWESLAIDLQPFGPSTEPDEIAVALYPPTASTRRSLLAREFIGWLGSLVSHEKIRELSVWADAATLSHAMRRTPSTIPIEEIEKSIKNLGGHYPFGEVRRFHAALNFLSHKHFVILSGISGTGKTQLALKYARAVHGVEANDVEDPLLFNCPVRPEWTDPTGLLGYYDVLTNRYVVPAFLEAVLVATAHRESPVFVILDEMNLAPVEYYLSEVLSAMESRTPLQLHSHGIPLEGTTGTAVRAAIPLPENLFIIGTVNVDETTNPISNKVLDRASVIDMSSVDIAGFLKSLTTKYPDLEAVCKTVEEKLTEVHKLLSSHNLGFGYRVIEEFVRYHSFDASHLKNPSKQVTDDLLVQKVLIKLRGSERQRPLLSTLEKLFYDLPRSLEFVRSLQRDLDEFGSFQAMR